MNILVVDDELDTLKAVIQHLEGVGHRVQSFGDPYQARAVIQSKPTSFDFAIIDKSMSPDPASVPDDEYPDPKEFFRLGVDLALLICRQAPRCPIIFLSAFLDANDRIELGSYRNIVIMDKGRLTTEALMHQIRRLRN